jgi:hypothetical protein
MGDGVGFDVGFTGVGLSLLVFVSASGFSPDNIREVLLTGITGKEKMKDQKAVLLLVQRCHCWFKTILFLLPLVQNDSLLYYLLRGTGRFCIASYRTL